MGDNTNETNAPGIDALREEARHCRACDLWRNATQTVFGEGSRRVHAMLVGEQPGDREDVEGRPFVGPAGALLDRALAQAGLDRKKLYVTNAVKHFKWEPRGKRRLHKTPAQQEIEACHRWLAQEIAVLRPRLIICLGATAARAVSGRAVTLKNVRGAVLEREQAPSLLFTVHPSFVLRVPGETRDQVYAAFVSDLRAASTWLA